MPDFSPDQPIAETTAEFGPWQTVTLELPEAK